MKLSKSLILASGSPRRRELMTTLGIPFEVKVSEADESFPLTLPVREVAAMLARRKAEAVLAEFPQALVLAADTVVILGEEILNKPENKEEATAMLRKLSGKTHEVYTSFCLACDEGMEVVTDVAHVSFKTLTEWEIQYYVDHGKPLDKAGAYGIQEWIGLIAVERIEGSYFTVMGLPMHMVWKKLETHITS